MIIVRLQGGLGNQLFQYACGRALALRNNVPLKLDLIHYTDPSYAERRPYLLDRLRIQAAPAGALNLKLAHGGRIARAVARLMPGTRYTLLRERGLAFHPEVALARGNLYLIGYWQCEEYFRDARETLLAEFQVKSPPSGENARLLDAIAEGPSVSVHVRRGDFATVPGFHTLTAGYYQRAAERIEQAVPSPRYFVFSDDPDWARANLPLARAVFVSVNGPDSPEEDLRLMRACSHHIIANSTLSWWGAWLCENPNKTVIAPLPWFADSRWDESDIIPRGWVRLPIETPPRRAATVPSDPSSDAVGTTPPSLSVIVCTRDRAEFLAQCLDALAAQTAPREPWELIVVNNASRDATPQLLNAEVARGRLPLRVIEKPRPGLSRARNEGLRAARGQGIVFLDDDALPAPGWLQAYHRRLIVQSQPLVQGRILLRFLAARPRWLGDALLPALSYLDAGEEPCALEWLFGANFGAARSLFERLGGFRVALGAGASGFGEDTDFLRRAQAAGVRVEYAPDACVTHVIPPERATRRALLRRYYRSGLSQPLFMAYREPTWRLLAYWSRRSAVSLIRALFARDAARMRRLCDLAEHTGRVAGILRGRRRLS